MAFSFVPGEPSKCAQAVSQAQWRQHTIIAYISGNNLILLLADLTHLQTLGLDCDASAVDVDGSTGRVAVAVGAQVKVYEPLNEFAKQPRWALAAQLEERSNVNCVNWGRDGELVSGSDSLTLWSVRREFGEVKTSVLWSTPQPQPVYLCKVSQDSTLIASCAKYDTLLKLWHRVSFANESQFDMTFLPHPKHVTEIRWKKFDRLPPPELFTNTLYTLCADNVLRIWSSHEYENAHMAQSWGSLDLYADKSPGNRFVWILDQHLVDSVFKATSVGEEVQARMAKMNHDLAFVVDSEGLCTVYPMKQLSQNPPKLLDLDLASARHIQLKSPSMVTLPEFIHFAEPLLSSDGEVSILIHDLNGVIRHVNTDLKFLWNDDIRETGYLAHKLTGHLKSIQRVFKTGNGEAMLTCSRFDENAIWVPQQLRDNTTLNKKSTVHTPTPISQAVLFDDGNQLLTICHSSLILWDTSHKVATEVKRLQVNVPSSPQCFAIVPIEPHDHRRHHAVAIYKHQTRAWLITQDQISELKVQSLPNHDDAHLIETIDPVSPIRIQNKEILSMIDLKGLLRRYFARIRNDELVWVEAPVLYSNIPRASYIRGSTVDKFAIVDESKRKLTIWDLSRMVLEYEEEFEDQIRDIDWTSTKNKQSILAVGFDHYSLLYTQLRYDYTNKQPPFLAFKKVDIQSYTAHKIGDSVWLKDGTLAVGSGNQIFVADKALNMDDSLTKKSIGSRNIVSNDIITLCSVLNGTLPVYHPQLLIQSLFNEKVELVNEILLRLFLKTRELELEGESMEKLGSTLGLDVTVFFDKKYKKPLDFEEPYTEFNSKVAELLRDKLTNHSLPYLTRHQQITLMGTIEAMVEINNNLMTLDANGLRFFLGMKLFQMHKGTQDKLSMRDINWALHSENKELLLQQIETSAKGKILWHTAKEYGLSYWLKYDDLVRTIESIARNEFTNGVMRDPTRCAIFYLSLNKKQILLGLWRTAAGNPEQAKMVGFLKNDFREERWRTAALKNAFVLLSKHRFMDAACFFLLSGSLKDCVNVLVRQICDVELAIAVCRVSEGDNGPVLKALLMSKCLPDAVNGGDRWSTSYVYWKLQDKSRSIQALVRSPIDTLNDEEKVNVMMTEKSSSFLEDDPLLIMLYLNLREKNLSYFHGSLQITPQVENEFILRVASIYTRMGCDYLSVYLLKNWSFVKPDDLKKNYSTVNLQRADGAESMLEKFGLSAAARRRTSMMMPDESGKSILEKYGLASDVIKRKEENVEHEHKNYTPPPMAAFQEPDMSAFSFGF